MSVQDLVVVDSAAEAAATCVVCGNDIPAGEGVTAQFGDQTLRFKCPGCLSRFAVDPDRYLSGGPTSCCKDEHGDAGHAHTSHAGHAADRMVEARALPVWSGREIPPDAAQR